MQKNATNQASIKLVTLKDFPRRQEIENEYFVDKSHWPNGLRLLRNPRRLLCGDKGRFIYDVLRCFSIIAATAALVIALVKDFTNEDDSLALTIAELVLALIAVSGSLLKHSLEWRHMRKNLKKFQDACPGEGSNARKCSKRCCFGLFNSTLIVLWFFCCSLLVVGFGVFHLLDDSEKDLLKYTKFSTALTLFVSWILDAMVAEALSEVTLHWNMDRCALLIHVIKEELYHELRKAGNETRIGELEKYLDGDKVLDVEKNRRILVKARHENGNHKKDITATQFPDSCAKENNRFNTTRL
eukprot:gene5256-5920_t